ncbi:MAG: hypothetical protein MZU91_08195 [Desulfosudis oleivorans]|nr:hypothetical protein [Desulfosudis oleivorans]
MAEQYLILGISDFKIKLCGNLKRDIEKLDILEELSVRHHAKPIRIRLDANNLWKDRCDEAIEYTNDVGGWAGICHGRTCKAKNAEDISKFSTATGLPVILDESLCTLEDLSLYRNIAGNFIANIKISKVGGLIRALKMIEELKKLRWPIIIGCHVGETSLLTRAALVVSGAAGDSLIAHEGAFGDYLVEREPASPMLKFGHDGSAGFEFSLLPQDGSGTSGHPPESWSVGFGMQCRMPSLRKSPPKF